MKKTPLFLFSLILTPPCLAKDLVAEAVEVSGQAAPAASPFERNIRLERPAFESLAAPDANNMVYGQPGVKIVQNKAGSSSGISLKGASGGMGLLTLDGVPLFANFAGVYALRNYPLDMLDGISVGRNEGLSMENSRTLSGAIHLNSRRMAPEDYALHLEGGSKEWFYGSAATGIATAAGNVSLAAGWNQTFHGDSQAGRQNGGIEGDNQRLGHALINIGKTLAQGEVFASFYYVRADDDFDGPALMPGRKVRWSDDPNGWSLNETLVGQVKTDLFLSNHWQSTLQLGGTQHAQDGMAGLLRRSMQIDNRLWFAKWQNVYTLTQSATSPNDVKLLWGADFQDQYAESQATGKSLEQSLISPSIGLSWDIERWKLYAKGRNDGTQQSGDHTLWSAGAAWRPTQDSRLWANAGSSFRTASGNEILHPLFGNTALKPESGQGWDVGWSNRLTAATSLQLNYYRQDYRNLITFLIDPSTGASRAGNLADVAVEGLDAEWRQTWTPAWNTVLQYGYMDAKNRLLHLDVPVRPHNKIALQNQLRLSERLTFNLELNWHDGFWFDSQHVNKAGSVVKLNGALHYAINPTLSAYLRAENLGRDTTVESYGLGYPDRTFYLGIRLQSGKSR